MSSIERYRTYRKIGTALNHKIMDACLDRDALMKSGKLLGIAWGNTFIFSSEDETSVLMDFALNEYRISEKKAVQIYRDRIGGTNEIEKDILDSLLSSYTSLFRITSISRADHILHLRDLLNEKDGIELVDISFSKTASPHFLVFTRLVPFGELFMTSGISFIFPGFLEKELIEEYEKKRKKRKKRKKLKSRSKSMQRFIAFFELNKTHGIDVRYQ